MCCSFVNRRTEPRPQVTCTENFVKFGHVVFETCKQTDKETDRHADHSIWHRSWGRSNYRQMFSSQGLVESGVSLKKETGYNLKALVVVH